MKNKAVSIAINNILRGRYYQSDITMAKDYIEQLEKEVELKDKQLDKACDMLPKMRAAAECWEFINCPFREECSKSSEIDDKEDCYKKHKWIEVFKR